MSRGKYNFVSDLLMNNLERIKIMGYEHKGYVGRLHSVASYYKLNMDFSIQIRSEESFYNGNQVYTKIKDEVPAKYLKTASVKNSPDRKWLHHRRRSGKQHFIPWSLCREGNEDQKQYYYAEQ